MLELLAPVALGAESKRGLHYSLYSLTNLTSNFFPVAAAYFRSVASDGDVPPLSSRAIAD
jgi:hypothetical protein